VDAARLPGSEKALVPNSGCPRSSFRKTYSFKRAIFAIWVISWPSGRLFALIDRGPKSNAQLSLKLANVFDDECSRMLLIIFTHCA